MRTRAVLDGQLRTLEPFGADERPFIVAVSTSDPRAAALAQAAISARRDMVAADTRYRRS